MSSRVFIERRRSQEPLDVRSRFYQCRWNVRSDVGNLLARAAALTSRLSSSARDSAAIAEVNRDTRHFAATSPFALLYWVSFKVG
jgi:hypothetical protein